MKRQIERDLFHIQLRSYKPNPIELTVGQTAKVTLSVLMPQAITSDPGVKFEIPTTSGLKVTPSQIPLNNAKPGEFTDVLFDVTAGTATGTFFIKVNPSQGDPFELKVIVK